MRIGVRMLGTLRDAAGIGEKSLNVNEGSDVDHAIRLLLEESPSLEEALIDSVLESPLPNAIILLNGVEIGNLQSLKTPLREGDELILLSVTHGG